jgi:crotonobetainyl-CoA:carnitine CoA-transferase CaiB-like acyl-CoA transferase
MQRDDIDLAIRTAGLAPPAALDVAVEGDDPFFRSPLRLACGASAALAMLGAAVDGIWQARGNPPQRVSIDARHAALSLLSMWLLEIDGALASAPSRGQPGGARPAASGGFRCADGQTLHLQPGFPDHGDAIRRVLDCDAADREAVAARIATWRGTDIEDALSEAGAPAVIVRTWDEWQRHPQGVAMRDVPVVEIERIGDAPPVPLAPAERVLAGLRVLDLTRVLAGPTCARLLAEHGADVLHVDGPRLPDLRPGQVDTSRGKRMTFVDLDQADGVRTLETLAGSADVFVQSYRAGSLARRGFGPERLAALRPGIVYVSVNCYGHHGPWVTRHGYDGNAMAATGIQVVHGGRDGRPVPGIAVAMNDYCTAYWGAYGVLAALLARARDGGSWHVRVSLVQSAMWFLRMGTPHDPAAGLPPEEIRRIARDHLEVEDSAWGRLARLRPALGMTATPPRFDRGTPTPGEHAPVWLDRA